MILSGKEIQKRLGTDIIIEPFNENQLNPNSYNLKLHNELLVYDNMYTLTLDMKKENKTKKIIIPEEGLVLVPGELYLGRTCETVHTDKLLTLLEGRSSLARLGITIHVSAGFIDTGYQGAIVLEIFCIRPVRIYPWVEIGQIYYSLIEGELMQYAGKYQNTKDIIPSMLYKDFQK